MVYVPILKDKEAEYRALKDLADDVRNHVMPLIEPLPLDAEDDADPSIKRTASRLVKAWPTGFPFLLDGGPISIARTSTGEHPLYRLWHMCRQVGHTFIPVTAIGRDDDYQTVVREIIEAPDNLGVCLRLTGADFEADYPAASVTELLQALGTGEADTHLLVDFGPLASENAGPMTMLIRACLEAIPNLTRWRTVTVSGTAFPATLGRFKSGSIGRVPRTEWKAWLGLRARPPRRIPQFSDYAIQHPQVIDFDPKTMDVSAAIRYASDEEWVIVRGRSVKKHKAIQMHSLCEKLAALPEYKGPDFSKGDQWINACAQRRVSPGSGMVWRQVATGHHITLVVRQLASLPGV